MAAPFAASSDLAQRWRALKGAQVARADTLLGAASRIIRHNFPTVDARIAAGSLDMDTVVDVTCWMVERVMSTSGQSVRRSTREIATVTITEEREVKAGAGGLYLTDDEYDLLTPPPETVRRGLPRWSC